MLGGEQLYERLQTSEMSYPALPPNYDDLEVGNGEYERNIGQSGGQSGTYEQGGHSIEQFEIEDAFDESPEREGFFIRASLMTKKFANNFNNKIVNPVARIIDPMYEGYQYFQMQYERTITKVGNPLVVKRLVYVFFVMVIIFFVTRYSNGDGVNGTSGGAFSNGKFYDIDLLSSAVKKYIDPKLMKENLEYFSSMPHITGSKGDLALAKYIESYMKNNGISVREFNELQSFTNYPSEKDTYVKLSDGSVEAQLYELHNTNMQYLSYNSNSLNTNDEIEAPFTYVNFGNPEDFQKLEDNKIKIEGSILLIKYGGKGFPEANKIQLAQKHNAKAIVFISPKFEIGTGDQTVVHDDVIQKINVGLTRVSPGDILTPGWASEDGYVTRLPWFKSEITPKLPTIPISYRDGEKFLNKLNKGFKFDDGFYSGNDNPHKIKLKITNDQRPTHQIWNVVGSIQGREQPGKGIVIGSARDSSCYGTLSSNTGSVVLLEMIKILTSIQREYNWSPSRSIYFVSFDASEYNLAGLAEWIENRKELLKNQGYAYIDLSDVIAGDELSVKSHPFLHDLIKKSLQKVGNRKEEDKEHKRDQEQTNAKRDDSLYDLYKSQNNGHDAISNNLIEQKNYIPFINLINIPSLEIKFTGKKYPKNSCYDNFENFESSGIDSSMVKHGQIVELLTIITLNLAESPLIPYNFDDFSRSLSNYVKDLENYAQEVIKELDQRNIPVLRLEGLHQAVNQLHETGKNFQEWSNNWNKYIIESGGVEQSLLAMLRWKLNENMIHFNELFISKEIKSKRPGFVNLLFGVPYNAPEEMNEKHEWNTFPLVRDSLWRHDFGTAQKEIGNVVRMMTYAHDHLPEL